MPKLIKLNDKGLSEMMNAIHDKGLSKIAIAKETGIAINTVNKLVGGFYTLHQEAERVLHFLGITDLKPLTETTETEGIKVGRSAQQINRIVVNNLNTAAEELSNTPVDDVQGIASAQLKILASYYSEGLTQAKTSFRWAAIVSGIGFAFFLTAVVFVLNRQPRDRTLIPLISGAVIEVVAGINFYLYGQATKQLAAFQHRLDQTQRFLLANSICESLEGEGKQTARVELVRTVSSIINQSD